MTTTRRDFIKRSAAAGAVVWSAPTITTLAAPRAWADHYQPACDAQATGLIVRLLGEDLLVLGRADRPEEGEVCTVRVGRIDERPDGTFTYEARSILGLFRLAAEIACGQIVREDGTCKAIAKVADLVIELGDGDDDGVGVGLLGALHLADGDHPRRRQVIRVQLARAEATSGDPATGESFLTKVTDAHGRNLLADADCNFDVSVAGVVQVRIDEQECHDGQLVVRAVHVLIPAGAGELLEIIGGEARARGATCRSCA